MRSGFGFRGAVSGFGMPEMGCQQWNSTFGDRRKLLIQYAGRLHVKSFATQYLFEVACVPSCIESFVLDSNLERLVRLEHA